VKIAWRALAAPLGSPERRRVRAATERLVAWQRDLSQWSVPRGVPDATPFVTLYVGGSVRGCFGSDEGSPGERLARAFLRALSDARFGGIAGADRAEVVAEVSYVCRVRACPFERLVTDVEPGTHGVGLVGKNGSPVVLLPSVARDDGLAAPGLVAALARKAGLPDVQSLAALPTFLFETSTVVCRPGGMLARIGAATDLAAAWLTRMVGDDGQVLFGLDGRTGAAERVGLMHHGRAAAAIGALARHGGHARVVARGRARLVRDVESALAGKPLAGWPTEPAQRAATVALAALAGAELLQEVGELSRQTPELERAAWHAAQVVAACGPAAPPALWQACVASLDREPWAPWTVIAARAYGDMAVVERAERALVASVRRRAPYAGGVSPPSSTGMPEIALTALVAEALAASTGREAKAALRLAREFLLRWQVKAYAPACAAPAAFGAFPATPVSLALRCDMTGHALAALC
jgi:AMMECR1 domain-containing protein